ncbi:hypothetical protein LINPERPRIM_LOCUS30992 [Linum perenne]
MQSSSSISLCKSASAIILRPTHHPSFNTSITASSPQPVGTRSLLRPLRVIVPAGGGISRFKNHLAGVSGNVRACPKAPPDVRAAMLKNLGETSKKNRTLAAQKRSFSEITREDSSSEPNYSEVTPGSNEDTTPIRSPNPCPRSGGSLLQPNIKSALRGKDAALRTDRAIARFWYEHCLPFNVVASPSFPVLINMIASMGAGYTGPSYHAIRTTLLDDIYAECKLTVDSMRIHWKNFGCTIMADGWTDNRQRSLINFLIYSPKGISFVKSVDASGFPKTGKKLFELFDSVIQWVGVQNVVQVVTDNAANYVAAGKMIHSRYKNIYWTSCVAHTVNLVFKDICALPHIAKLTKSASTITTFLYNHGALLHWLRERPTWKEIVRPGATRFATTFLTLQSIVHQQVDLECLMVDESFRESALDMWMYETTPDLDIDSIEEAFQGGDDYSSIDFGLGVGGAAHEDINTIGLP